LNDSEKPDELPIKCMGYFIIPRRDKVLLTLCEKKIVVMKLMKEWMRPLLQQLELLQRLFRRPPEADEVTVYFFLYVYIHLFRSVNEAV
jgi:hypothetical protein